MLRASAEQLDSIGHTSDAATKRAMADYWEAQANATEEWRASTAEKGFRGAEQRQDRRRFYEARRAARLLRDELGLPLTGPEIRTNFTEPTPEELGVI